MKNKKELMDSIIEENIENIFELFYGCMTGDINLENLSDEKRIIAECIRNECTAGGDCYELYFSLRKIRNSKTKTQITELYECILKVMCKKMFFNAFKLGMVVRKTKEHVKWSYLYRQFIKFICLLNCSSYRSKIKVSDF